MPKIEACCFTGYRPHKFPFPFKKGSAEYVKLENKLFDAILTLTKQGCRKFYCGMAMGFDLLAGEVVVMLKKARPELEIELIAAVAFEGQSDSFRDEWKARYDRVMNEASLVVYVSREYTRACYFSRNCYMVDNSDAVITWFDGQTGGTAQTLSYAARKGKQIINLSDDGVHEYIIESPYEIIFDD